MLQQTLHYALGERRVEVRHRLIEDQEPGFREERPRDRASRALSCRENRHADCTGHPHEATARRRETTDDVHSHGVESRLGMASQDRPEQASPHCPVRIVLADDHQVVRRGLQLVLDGEPDFEVVSQGGDLASVRREVLAHQPDVLVLDLNMPGGSVLDALPGLRKEAPGTQIVVLTMDNEPSVAQAVMRAGARGFVLKEAAHSELALAVRRVAAGEGYVNPQLAGRMALERIRSGSID